MAEGTNKNPFLALFGAEQKEDANTSGKASELREANRISEEIFHLCLTQDNESIRTGKATHLVVINDIPGPPEAPSLMDLDCLKLAIFERILLTNPAESLIVAPNVKTSNFHAVQSDCIFYLFECYRKLSTATDFSEDLVATVIGFIVENAATALRQTGLFENQDLHKQILDLYQIEESDLGLLNSFITSTVQHILSDGEPNALSEAFDPILYIMKSDFENASIINYPRGHFTVLMAFAAIPPLAEVVCKYMTPTRPSVALTYSTSLLGCMLNLSCLPKNVEGMVEFFEKPLDGALSALESNLWRATSDLCDKIHALVELLIRNGGRLILLTWFGRCLDTNIPRGRIWATTPYGLPGAIGYISDGMALNIAAVLLRLCRPFIRSTKEARTKLLKIDPTYSAAEVDINSMNDKNVHCLSLKSEATLQPREEGDELHVATEKFSFITEIFHLTHRALDLSVRVVLEKAQTLYQEIGRLQQTLNEAQGSLTPRPDMVQVFTERMELEMSRYLCMRCALLEPNNLELIAQFEVGTAIWVAQLLYDSTADEGPHPKPTYAPLKMRTIAFPPPERTPFTFKCVSELIVESVGRFLKLAKTYSPQTLEQGGPQLLEPLLTMLLLLMGSNSRARNPHLRAHLAQCLECLLPRDQEQPSLNPNPLGVFYREKLFHDHPHRLHIVECLLSVFVSIEMTGESVAFEQKFNYRRPMYIVMDYLWGIPEHREVFKLLSTQAEANMEEVTPPLFLRFLNLLINDAIFLLDEALSNMAQLRTLQTARDAGEWNNLSLDERDRNEQFFRQIGMTARFDNILGKETIHTLEYMSSEIKSILCHSMMVDRIASMLNYFLFHLVGPKKKNFKVKDQNDYKFDPGGIVLDICRIYVHLGTSDVFCGAVSNDGRSYSPQLFSYATNVLTRIGGVDLLAELERVSQRVDDLARQQKTDEELLAEAPEEFLDPIMSTLMVDPVILPSSKITIDRSTIARHLLSDQIDPFNRSPLTMNMVLPNTELKKRIEEWIAERRQQLEKS